MKRINSELIEVVDPTGTYKLWLRQDIVEYAYDADQETITVGYRSEEFEVSRSSWDLLRRSMSKSLTE